MSSPSSDSSRNVWLWVHGGMTLCWFALIPLSYLTGLINKVWFVTLLSLIALILGSWSAWQAARVEAKQDEQEQPTPRPTVHRVRGLRPAASRTRPR
jgi:cadmium resistance protein CadD (predicted permease)